MEDRYLDPNQAQTRPQTQYEDLLGDAIERAYGSGITQLDELVAYLNKSGPLGMNGAPWTPETFKQEMARLGE